MPEKVEIPIETDIDVQGSNVTITLFFKKGLPDTVAAFISEIVATLNGIPYIEGELVITMVNSPADIDFEVDSNGDLIVFSDDASKYSINDNGDLIYTTP